MHDPEQHMVVIRPASAWAQQARDALARLEAMHGGPADHLADLRRHSPVLFGQMVQALVALEPLTGKPVSDELIQLAGLRPVDQVLGED